MHVCVTNITSILQTPLEVLMLPVSAATHGYPGQVSHGDQRVPASIILRNTGRLQAAQGPPRQCRPAWPTNADSCTKKELKPATQRAKGQPCRTQEFCCHWHHCASVHACLLVEARSVCCLSGSWPGTSSSTALFAACAAC